MDVKDEPLYIQESHTIKYDSICDCFEERKIGSANISTKGFSLNCVGSKEIQYECIGFKCEYFIRLIGYFYSKIYGGFTIYFLCLELQRKEMLTLDFSHYIYWHSNYIFEL